MPGTWGVFADQAPDPLDDHGVLVIKRRIFDRHGDVAWRQMVVIKSFDTGGDFMVVVLLEHEGGKLIFIGHGFSYQSTMVQASVRPAWNGLTASPPSTGTSPGTRPFLLFQGQRPFVDAKPVKGGPVEGREGFEFIERGLRRRTPGRRVPAPRARKRYRRSPQAASLALTVCGAESVPRKNFASPEVAAFLSAKRWHSRLATGRQYMCGRMPPSNMAPRLIIR